MLDIGHRLEHGPRDRDFGNGGQIRSQDLRVPDTFGGVIRSVFGEHPCAPREGTGASGSPCGGVFLLDPFLEVERICRGVEPLEKSRLPEMTEGLLHSECQDYGQALAGNGALSLLVRSLHSLKHRRRIAFGVSVHFPVMVGAEEQQIVWTLGFLIGPGRVVTCRPFGLAVDVAEITGQVFLAILLPLYELLLAVRKGALVTALHADDRPRPGRGFRLGCALALYRSPETRTTISHRSVSLSGGRDGDSGGLRCASQGAVECGER